MTFSRTLLAVVAVAAVAGGVYGYVTYQPPVVQTADVLSAVLPATPELLLGTWTSQEDGKYQVTFGRDGSLVEQYDGAEVGRGTYRFADSPAGYVSSDDTSPKETPYTYLLEDIDGERYAYRILEVSVDALRMTYLERGNTLTFSR